MWSHGCVDLNDLGTSVLMLPSKGWFPGSVNHDAVIAQVRLSLGLYLVACLDAI
jgi:hypothetical protein